MDHYYYSLKSCAPTAVCQASELSGDDSVTDTISQSESIDSVTDTSMSSVRMDYGGVCFTDNL